MGDEVTTETANKFMGMLDQTEVKYTPVSIIPGKACSSCIWWRGDSCHIVAGYPESIVPNGYCDEHRVATPLAPQNIEPIPVVIVEPPMNMDDSAEMALPTTRRGLKELILDMFKAKPNTEQAFTVFKAQDGNHYWLSRHTGKFIDREQEIITDKAHDEYVARVQKGIVPMPELWTWHKKGTSHGQADFVWKSGGFTLALGHFTGTSEQVKQSVGFYQKMGDKIKLSHMFKYPKRGKRGKVYHAYNTVEITTLPDGAEAFPYTSFQEFDMSLTTEQREFIKGIGGDDMLKRVEGADTKALTDTTKLEAAGVSSKNLDNFEGSTLPEDEELKTLKASQDAIETRLKAVEQVPALITALQVSLKALNDQLAVSQKANSDALKVANDTALKLAEYQAVAPPASKSGDTLLSDREESLLQTVMDEAKQNDSLSIIERAMGKSPAVSA